MQANFDEHYVWTVLLSAHITSSQIHVRDSPVHGLLALRAVLDHTLLCCALHTVGGLLQITYPRLLCLLVFRWIHTVGDTVKNPRSREIEKTGSFALLSLSRLGAWQRLLQMPVLARQSCFSSSNSHWVAGSCLLYSLRFSAVVTLWVTSQSSDFHSSNTSATISLY